MTTCPSCGAALAEQARFCQQCGHRLPVAATETRRQVTVLFCDVVESTALGAALDPEVVRAAMTSYMNAASVAIERHGGTLEKFIGDAVMAVFGLPELHEDDALRAVRAAFDPRPKREQSRGDQDRGVDRATP